MTDEQRWLSRKYLWYQVFTESWYTSAVWLYFYRLFINDQQVGVLDGMAFAIGILAEVPSGALADKFGRGRLIRLGLILISAGALLHTLGSSFMPFFVGQTVLMVGLSFVSGADDALFFERLQFDRGSSAWRKLVTRGSQFGRAGSLLATITGGILYAINPRIPWALMVASMLVPALMVWGIKDTRLRSSRQRFMLEIRSYIHDVKTGFGVFTATKLRLYIPIIITIQGLFYAAGYGLLRVVLLSRFQFSPFAGAVVLATSSIVTIGLLGAMHRHAGRLSEKGVITGVALAAIIGLISAVFNIGAWGALVIFMLLAGEHTLYPFMSEVLNNHAPEAQRATVLSVASFFRMLPYVIMAPVIGTLNVQGKLSYFLVAWSLLIGVALGIYLTRKRRDTQVILTSDIDTVGG